MGHIFTRCTAATALLLSLYAAPARSAPPSMEEAQSAYETGDYRSAIAAVNRLVGPGRPALPSGTDRSALYEIKAESHLHLKQWSESADAYAIAARAATDTARAAVDRAMELLARRSRGTSYQPVQPGPDGKLPPIDLLNIGGRKAAYAALFTDEWAAAAGRLRQFDAARTLPQLMAAADALGALRDLELVGTDADAVTKPAIASLAARAKDPFTVEMRRMDRRASDIDKAANAKITYYARIDVPAGQTSGNVVPRQRRIGLTRQNMADLKSIIDECARIGPVAAGFAKCADDAAPAWDGLATDATRVSDAAHETLTADYSIGTGDR